MRPCFRFLRVLVIASAVATAGCPPDGSGDGGTEAGGIDGGATDGGPADVHIMLDAMTCYAQGYGGSLDTDVETVDPGSGCPSAVGLYYRPEYPADTTDLAGCCFWPAACRFDVHLHVEQAGPNCPSAYTEAFSSCFCNNGQIECDSRGVCDLSGACYPFDRLPSRDFSTDCGPPPDHVAPEASFAE